MIRFTQACLVACCLLSLSALVAEAAPAVQAEPSSLYFAPSDSTHTFVIRNSGDGALNWTLTKDKSWIAVQPDRGTTRTGTSAVTVTISRNGMAAGVRQTGTITVNSNGGSATISVVVDVRSEVAWPLAATNAAHVFDKCIGAYNSSCFHGAIDLPAATGTSVYPILTGVVRRISRTTPNNNANDYLHGVVWISPTATSSFSWAIGHIYDIPVGWKSVATDGVANATAIPNVTTSIGRVADWPANTYGAKDHIHIEKVAGTGGFNTTIINPLHELRPLPTLRPRLDPTLFKRDGSTSTTHDFNTMLDGARVVQGDVDFVSHSTTQVTAGTQTENDRAEINAISHRIEGLGNVAGHDVSERFLFDFTVVARNFRDTTKLSLVYDMAHRGAGGSHYFNFVIATNCGERTDAQIRAASDAIVNVMKNAWQTAVDRGANDDDEMNGPTGTDDARAPNNGRAKYPDGRYRVTVRARTFNPSEAEQEAEVYVNNFSQTITANEPTYRTGEPVFVTGEDYQHNRQYTIYLIRCDTWPDHALIPHGSVVASVKATSDGDGNIPNTLLWAAYAPNGDPDEGYDIVVDYDGDGEYHLPRDGHTIDALNHIVGEGGAIEVDEFPDSWAEISVSLSPLLDRETITFTGPSTVEVYFTDTEGSAIDADGDGRDEVATQMVEMELLGESVLLGPIALRLRSATFGEIEETDNSTPGILDLDPFGDLGTANSYFDVFFEIELLEPPDFIKWFAPNLILLHNEDPVHMTSLIDHKPPPPGAPYLGDPVQLFDEARNPVAVKIGECVHVPAPSHKVSTQRWARAIWEYELPLCLTVCPRNRLCRGLVVEVMLEKFETYLSDDVDFMTPLLHLDASVIKDFLERATPEEIEELACAFAEAYLETEPCEHGSPCMQEESRRGD